MELFVLRFPQGSAVYGSPSEQLVLSLNLGVMLQEYDLAVVAYNGFREVMTLQRSDRPDWKERADRVDARYEELLNQRGFSPDLHDLAKDEIRTSDLSQGVVPDNYKYSLPARLHAEMFIVAVHRFLILCHRLQNVLKMIGASDEDLRKLRPHLDRMENYFNNKNKVKDVRDSMHHLEERLDFSGGKRGPFPNQVLMIGGMTQESFSASTADGQFGKVEISSRSMKVLQNGFQGILETLPWDKNVHWSHHPY